MAEAYIVAATRTAGGRKGGRMRGWHPADLGASVLNELVDRTGVDPAAIEDVVMGCVMQVGEQSTNIGRNAVLAFGGRHQLAACDAFVIPRDAPWALDGCSPDLALLEVRLPPA